MDQLIADDNHDVRYPRPILLITPIDPIGTLDQHFPAGKLSSTRAFADFS